MILTDNLGLNYKSPDEPVIYDLNAGDSVLNAIVSGKGKRPEAISGGTYRNPDFTSPDVFSIAEQTGGEDGELSRGRHEARDARSARAVEPSRFLCHLHDAVEVVACDRLDRQA